MFQIDEQFLEDLKLNQLPDDQKQTLLEHSYKEFEQRVGKKLAAALSDEQLTEFQIFTGRDNQAIRDWINMNEPNYQSDVTFQRIRNDSPEETSDEIVLAEYASLKWLERNYPDYSGVVAQVLEEVKSDIASRREAILSK